MNRDSSIGLATLAGLVVLVLGAIALAGANPAVVAAQIINRALLTRSGLAEAVTSAIPLCLIALGICVAFRARIFNIGGDGQVIVGAALAVALAPFLPGGFVGLAAILLLGAVGGVCARLPAFRLTKPRERRLRLRHQCSFFGAPSLRAACWRMYC